MTAVIDIRMPQDCRDALLENGFDIIPLPPFPNLPTPVASHPDMLVFLSKDKLLTHSNYYRIAREELDKISKSSGLEIVLSDELISNVYPHDVLFNAAHLGSYILAKRSAISHHISKICDEKNIFFVDVKQGYTKCSVCIVDNRAIITSDTGIATTAVKRGIDVLKIRPGHVKLDGYDTGFIGGASGCCGDTVYFCGNIDSHPDAALIRDFCAAHNKNVTTLGNVEPVDVGTIFFI